MPFRYILKRGGVEHPIGYSLIMLALGMIVCMLTAVSISVSASKKAIRDSEEQDRARQQESRRAACLVIVTQHNAMTDPQTRPVTPAGQAAAEAWGKLRRSFQCDEG